MNDNEFMTPEEMKKKLGLNPTTDNRTLNKYVRKGLLEIKPYSRKTKLYREVNDNHAEIETNFANDDWVIDFEEACELGIVTFDGQLRDLYVDKNAEEEEDGK